MIEAIDIHKSFGSTEILHSINLRIEPGQITALLGPSGAGKTTLMQIVGTLMPPTRGRVLYDGKEVTGMKDRKLSEFRNRNIGFVFQFHQLLPEFSALENVMLPALIGGGSRSEASKRAKEMLDYLGLGDRLKHKPAQLSGGECQRIAVARALVNKPSVVFADEPTGSLDPRNRDEIKQLFLSLCRDYGHTFVIVTHDMSLASIAHRVVRMDGGRIIAEESNEPAANQEPCDSVIEVREDAEPATGPDDSAETI